MKVEDYQNIPIQLFLKEIELNGMKMNNTSSIKNIKYNFIQVIIKQAEEEAETDDEMIEYGVKIASKTVRTATKAFVARDWSLLSRMKYYKLSVKKLQAVNRKRGR